MPPRKPGKAAELRSALEAHSFTNIGEEEWGVLLRELAPVAERTLRHLLRRSGLPLQPMVEGVRLESFDHLERTLLALAAEFARARAANDRKRERAIRRVVIVAKEHARMAGRGLSDPGRRAEKAEMAEWLLVWLANPAVFATWAGLRRRARGAG